MFLSPEQYYIYDEVRKRGFPGFKNIYELENLGLPSTEKYKIDINWTDCSRKMIEKIKKIVIATVNFIVIRERINR